MKIKSKSGIEFTPKEVRGKITQKQVAAAAAVCQATVSAFENGNLQYMSDAVVGRLTRVYETLLEALNDTQETDCEVTGRSLREKRGDVPAHVVASMACTIPLYVRYLERGWFHLIPTSAVKTLLKVYKEL